jgi:molybdate transport system permease protein
MTENDDFSTLVLTLQVATTATLALAPIAVALAWGIARWKRGTVVKVAIESVLTLPLVLPPTAIGILLLFVLGRSSPLGRALESLGIEIVFTWRAAAIASAVMALPLFVRSARTAFETIDPRLLSVARTLGDGPVRVFIRVAMPLAWRGIVAGALLSFCRALGEFGATILVAGNIPGRTQTLALAIFQRSQSGMDAAAMRLVALTSCVAFAVVAASELLSRPRREPFAP